MNRDKKTNIRYGIIPQNSLGEFSFDEIQTHGKDRDFEAALEEAKKEPDFDEQEFSDRYESGGDCTRFEYEKDNYKLITDSSGDVWCLESPYFTFAQFCSPCAPGACYLKNPLESPADSNKCYCLGLDWFDESNPCPYPVYSVKTGRRIVNVQKKVVCPNCNGTGKDTLARLASVRQCQASEIDVSQLNVKNFDPAAGNFDCFRCDGKKHNVETVETELPGKVFFEKDIDAQSSCPGIYTGDFHADLVNDPLPWQKAGLQQTATGYGGKLTSSYKINFNGRLYRIYTTCFSNCASHWFTVSGRKIWVS